MSRIKASDLPEHIRRALADADLLPKERKYHNEPVREDGIKFDSLAELRRYRELKMLESQGLVEGIRVHPRFDLHVPSASRGRVKVGTYSPDFWYYSHTEHRQVYEDVKSPATAKNTTYRLKRKMFEGEYGVELTEVEA